MEDDFNLSIDELRYDAIRCNKRSSKHISLKTKDPATSSLEDLDERMIFSKRRKTY